MAEFKQFYYSDTGTEITFIQGFIDFILSFDSSFSLEDEEGNPITVASQYEDRTSSARATFYINLGNGSKLRIQRRHTNNSNTGEFEFACSNDGYASVPRVSFDTSSWGLAIDTQYLRKFFIMYIKSDSMFILWIGGWIQTQITQGGIALSKITSGENTYTGFIDTIQALSATFYGNNTTSTYSPIFTYSAGAGNIDFVEKAIFTSASVKSFEVEEIKSCSTVPQWSNIALPDGRNFYAIATNAMVEVDPET